MMSDEGIILSCVENECQSNPMKKASKPPKGELAKRPNKRTKLFSEVAHNKAY